MEAQPTVPFTAYANGRRSHRILCLGRLPCIEYVGGNAYPLNVADGFVSTTTCNGLPVLCRARVINGTAVFQCTSLDKAAQGPLCLNPSQAINEYLGALGESKLKYALNGLEVFGLKVDIVQDSFVRAFNVSKIPKPLIPGRSRKRVCENSAS